MNEMSDADFCVQAGDEYFKEESYSEAEACYREALGLNPIHPYAAGYVLSVFMHVIEDPKDLAMNTLAFLRDGVDRWQHQNAHFLHHCGGAFMQSTLYTKACEYFSRAEENPENETLSLTLNMHGVCLFFLGDIEDAIAYLKRSNDVGESEDNYYDLIKCFSKGECFEDHEQYMRDQLSKDRSEGSVNDRLPEGLTFFEQHRCLSRFYSIWAHEIKFKNPALAQEKLSASLEIAEYCVEGIQKRTSLADSCEDLDMANVFLWNLKDVEHQFLRSLDPPPDYQVE